MKKVLQTDITSEKGNCFSACVSSILELDINDVPNVRQDFAWFQIMDEFASKYGYSLLFIHRIDYVRYDKGEWRKNAYIIASGASPRFENVMHSVVYQNDEMVHDPHPDGTGLGGTPDDYIIFVSLNPKTGE